jgi:hypothetical protein
MPEPRRRVEHLEARAQPKSPTRAHEGEPRALPSGLKVGGIPRRAASLALGCPLRAMPIARRIMSSRWVLRADGATRSRRRSVKM